MTNGGVPNDPDGTRPDQRATFTATPTAAAALRRIERPGIAHAAAATPAAAPATATTDSRVVRPPAPPPPYAGYPTTRTSGLAIASLVLGIVWIFWLGSILAVIFGHVALSQIKRSMGAAHGSRDGRRRD